MDLSDKLNYFKIGLSSGIIELEEFKKWLDENFMNSDNDLFLELEESKTLNEAISVITNYFLKVGFDENPKCILKDLLTIVKNNYQSGKWDLKQTANFLNRIRSNINIDFINEEPFFVMVYIQEGIGTWRQDKYVIEDLEYIFKFCE